MYKTIKFFESNIYTVKLIKKFESLGIFSDIVNENVNKLDHNV